MGRKKLYGERIELPVAEGTKGAIDTVLDEGETRLDFIRAAIERELKRRRKG
jgi:hypothetical protein